MRAVVQRVAEASVEVAGECVGRIGPGLMVLLGVGEGDGEKDARYIARKVAGLRVFDDEEGNLNLSVLDTGGAVLLVSQFTLYGDCRKGRRPSFSHAAGPAEAEKLYAAVGDELRRSGVEVETGAFQKEMQVVLVNDGPVTLLLDSERNF
ncbi:MAG: D-aminoacyl-tRNA deacylase [Planctomycetota bacterium]